jgi:2,3-bisphosphoglycerate-independent phosphoglycerate mutase
MSQTRKPTALIILDGWGHGEASEYNAIANANTPNWDALLKTYPNALIQTSGNAVGLPEGQMGNSEVGHMNLGAGRIVYQNFTRINKDVADGSFFDNEVLCNAIDKAKANGGAIHLAGLLSPGGVHSHEKQIFAACEMAVKRGITKLYVHGILDGRDVPPRSAETSIRALQAKLDELGTEAKAANHAVSGIAALEAAYARDEDDEFVGATIIGSYGKNGDGKVEDGDSIIFMNFRPDRAREITRAFVEPDFSGFKRNVMPKLADYVMLTEYAADIPASCAYPPAKLVNGIGEYVSDLGLNQLRIAETEKYAHVTFFFSGGREDLYPGEERILVPSPDVATYDLQPEMNAPELTDKLVAAIKSGKHDLIVCNYANGDMVGHTGVYSAAVKAAECIDECLKRITDAILDVNGECLITADHGNAEQMVNPTTGGPLTSHTTGPVDLVYVHTHNDGRTINPGSLCDVSPTLLTIMNLAQPAEMSGTSLIKK